MKARLVRERRTPLEWEQFTDLLANWFDEALPTTCRRPDHDTYIGLHASIIAILFSADNATIIETARREGRPADFRDLRNIDQSEVERVAFTPFYDAARTMLFEIEKLDREWGDYKWNTAQGQVSLSDITALFETILVFPRDPQADRPGPGRPRREWHDPGRHIGSLVRQVLLSLGLGRTRGRGKISLTDEASITVAISSKIVGWAYRDDVHAKAFADAMKPLKMKSPSLEEMFPHLNRLKEG